MVQSDPGSHQRRATSTLRRVGTGSWLLLGLILVAAVLFVALASLSGLVVPLIVATVVGILFVPLVDSLARFVPRSLAAGSVLVGLVGLSLWTAAVIVGAIVDQGPQIRAQVTAGLETIGDWLAGSDVDPGGPSELVAQFEALLSASVAGFASLLTSIFSSLAAFVTGTLVSLFILYFVLADWGRLSEWVRNHLGVPADLGAGMIDDTVSSLRRYFFVLTVSSLVTAVLIGITIRVLGLPLAFTIAVVTFTTSYVPYIGAIISGGFASLIALGAGGAGDAAIVLAVVLVVQNIVQPVVQTKYTEGALHLHPIVTFGSTIVGAAVAGILGATLSAPVVAMAISINKRLKNYDGAGIADT